MFESVCRDVKYKSNRFLCGGDEMGDAFKGGSDMVLGSLMQGKDQRCVGEVNEVKSTYRYWWG